ncbi:MAG: cob(I)yrinic acid a,c-diamide adenosyltransferase [Bacteroidales bacterium]|nr:cob(I)yrinic acid a,c-diamide adenosyltransferase [Bacteroidales bacterium]
MKKFKIYTKKGDFGKTSLIGMTDCNKSHPRVEAYGTLDELASFVGLLHDSIHFDDIKQKLLDILDDIFTLESHIATYPTANPQHLPSFESSRTQKLEEWIDKIEEELPELNSFILPIGHMVVSLSHVCRAISRRAERKLVAIHELEGINPIYLSYMNRLSDFFFVLARYLSIRTHSPEIPWAPNS